MPSFSLCVLRWICSLLQNLLRNFWELVGAGSKMLLPDARWSRYVEDVSSWPGSWHWGGWDDQYAFVIGTARQEHDAANVITTSCHWYQCITNGIQWISDTFWISCQIFSHLFTSFHHSFSSGILELEMETAGASGDARGSGTFSGLAWDALTAFRTEGVNSHMSLKTLHVKCIQMWSNVCKL